MYRIDWYCHVGFDRNGVSLPQQTGRKAMTDTDESQPSMARVLAALKAAYLALYSAPIGTADPPMNILNALRDAYPVLRAYGVTVPAPRN
jgi:hypothetical protein